ncbi:UNVERIFIED_CONTAM: hypothetical protein Sradi_0196600 [Sesamum radiatum]|uniref:Uncharacterized protein n=1 Tax=Sesamum radiatum TaxID=300843 RepID=A0AAW2VZW0_SESRA
MTKTPFVGQSAIANGLLDLVHTDDCGLLSIPAKGGFSYFITFTDDHSIFTELLPSFCGYALETAAKMLNIAPSKSVSQTPYEIWHAKPASFKYLRVWGSPAYIKRLVGDKLDLESSLCSQCDEVLIEESSEEPQHNSTTSFEPTVHTDSVSVLRRSTGESRVLERYGFVGLTNQLYNDPTDIDLDKWLESMKSEMDSMGSNQVWALVHPPKGADL